jgi:ribose transport system permease protein
MRSFLGISSSENIDLITDNKKTPIHLRLLALAGKYGTIYVMVAIIIGSWIASPDAFGTFTNFRNVITNISPAAIVAAGLTICLIAGDFDLSIGYIASFATVMIAGLLNGLGLAGIGVGTTPTLVAAIIIVLVTGAFIGLVNGLLVTGLGVNAFIATLGTGTIILALNLWYGKGESFPIKDRDSFVNISLGDFFGIPYPILIMFFTLLILWITLNRTRLGQYIKAVGDDAEAARRVGINVEKTRTFSFIICGACASLGGLLLGAAMGSADATAGDVYLLQSFAAAFLGSAALRNGEFHIVGTAIGVFTVAIGFNGLSMFNSPSFTSYLFAGLLLIVAVGLSTLSRKYASDI